MMDVDFATAVRMASASPAIAVGLSCSHGLIVAGARADLVLMDAEKKVIETWIGREAEPA